MNAQVTLVFVFTFIIHLIATLSYAIRIAGVRTGRIAVSLALFNLLLLFSRTSNTFQGPLLAKHVERNILIGGGSHLESDLRWLVFAASLATAVGMLLIPTSQRMFTQAIESFGQYRSVPRLLLRAFTPSAFSQLRGAAGLPSKKNLRHFRIAGAPWRLLLCNAAANSLITVGVFSSLYAGYLKPELRVTANNLSPVVNAFSTILLFVFIDPYLSLLTDDVVGDKASQSHFRKVVVLFTATRLLGTVLAQLILVPAARVIVKIAEIL